MCGRAILVTAVDDIAEMFEVPRPVGPELASPPRYNIAPGQDLVVVRASSSTTARDPRELARLRWGLVPFWAKDTKIASRCIQARAETVMTAPAFRDAIKTRRCLVIVDGFYEWSGTGKSRRPHLVHVPERKPFAIAGLWSAWKAPDATVLETCAVLTTAATGPIATLHHRMPLVLDADARERWLSAPPNEARSVMEHGASDRFIVVPVSTWVNDVKHDDPGCLAPPDSPSKEEPQAPPQRQTAFRFG